MTRRSATSRLAGRPRRNTVRPRSSASAKGQPNERSILKKGATSSPGKANPALNYLTSLAPSGRRSQAWALAEVARAWKRHPVRCAWRLAWQRITVSDITRVRQVLAAKFSPVTCNRALTALRRVLRECWRAGQLSREEMERLADFRGIRGTTLPGRAARPQEVEGLLAACERDLSPAGARDGAIVALCFAAGLRRAEAVALEVDDLLAEGEVAVAGKGGVLAIATLGAGAAWVERWLAVRGTAPGPLLVHVRASGKMVLQGLCGAAVGAVITKRARQAGVRLTAHALRRGFATELLRHGHDHLLVARALRHRDMRSVQRYDGRSDLERALAVRGSITLPAPGGGHP